MRQQLVTLQSHKTDLLLINEISKPSQIAQLQAPSNMTQLHNLLRAKNAKASHTRQDKQNAQAWLNKEGIDITPLVERVRKVKQITIQKQELKKIQEDCFFYIPDMSYKKLEQYQVKASDYGTLTLIQKNMKKNNFSKKIMNKINSKYAESKGQLKQLSSQKSLGIITEIRTQTRDEEKRQKYLKCITSLAKRNIQRDELAHHISINLNKKFWKILVKHTKCLNENKSISHQEKLTQLYLESLKIVQDEYDSTLARGTQSLNYYLTSNYLQKLDKREQKYVRDREHSAFWGKAFILYRAGRKKDFYNLLATRNETQLLQNFSAVDQSIQQKAPITKQVPIKQGDVFKDQLIYSLRGEAKYNSRVLVEPTTLDIVWLMIRNLAIFYSRSHQQFENFKAKLLESYTVQPFLTEQQLYNYFYLLAYDQIAQMGLTDIMDQDDYVHFLICLNQQPDLMGKKSDRIKKLLTTQLMLYIRELISLGKSEYVYYMPLIPKEDRITEISTILSASNLVSSFNWQYLKTSIPTTQEFEQIVKRTLQKYITTTNDYFTAAEKYIELLNYSEESVKCLLQFLIKNFYRNSFDDENVHRAQDACDKYIYRNSQLESKYRPVLKFLIECRKLLELLRDRKDSDIYNIIRADEFVLLGAVIPQKHHQFFSTLISLSGIGLDVYFKFLKTVIKGLEIYYYRQNNNSELTQFVSLVEQNLKFILSFDQYKAFSNREQANSLRELINSAHYEVSRKR